MGMVPPPLIPVVHLTRLSPESARSLRRQMVEDEARRSAWAELHMWWGLSILTLGIYALIVRRPPDPLRAGLLARQAEDERERRDEFMAEAEAEVEEMLSSRS